MSESEVVEEIDADEVQLLVNDPDDYHETQRLREIHEARREVHKTLRDIDRYAPHKDHCRQRMALADAVTAYITELEPLIRATDWEDELDESHWGSLSGFATVMGRLPEPVDSANSRGQYHTASYEASMYIFRQANQFLDEVKPLVEEETKTEWEV